MQNQSFRDYIYNTYNSSNSGTAPSYMKAIQILDELLHIDDVFQLENTSLSDVKDPHLLDKIIDYVAEQEDNYRKGVPSIFDAGRPNQTSYPKRRFCTAAIRRLGDYVNSICCEEASAMMSAANRDGASLSRKLMKKFQINDQGTDKEVLAKRRIGQNIFRAMLLNLYGSSCCLTGIDVPDVLRASHIIPWAENKTARLNPQNGLCLSATYDAAFDRHLISFDEDYRLILSPIVKELYSSEAFKTHFLNFEGRQITLPTSFLPSQIFLEEHRSKLVV